MKRPAAAACAAAAAAVLLAHAPVLDSRFLNLDDYELILYNDGLRLTGLAWLKWIWGFACYTWQPLGWAVHSLLLSWFGLSPAAFHAVGLAAHAANAALVCAVGAEVLGAWARGRGASPDPRAVWAAACFGGLLFALHPLQAELVTIAVALPDILASSLFFASLYAYLRGARASRRGPWRAGSLALFALSALFRWKGMHLPAVMLILDVYPLRRLGGAEGWRGPRARAVLLEKVPFLALGAFAMLMTVLAKGLTGYESALPIRADIGTGLLLFAVKFLAPWGLSPQYTFTETTNPLGLGAAAGAAAAAGLTILFFALRRKAPGLMAAWLCQLLGAAPLYGQPSGPGFKIFVHDHDAYLAVPAFCVLAAGGFLALLLARRRAVRAGALAAAALLCAGLGVLTRGQLAHYRDSEALWRRVLSLDPDAPFARLSLALALDEKGRRGEAIEEARRQASLHPEDPQAPRVLRYLKEPPGPPPR